MIGPVARSANVKSSNVLGGKYLLHACIPFKFRWYIGCFWKIFSILIFPGKIGFENVQIAQEIEMGIKIYTVTNVFLNFCEIGNYVHVKREMIVFFSGETYRLPPSHEFYFPAKIRVRLEYDSRSLRLYSEPTVWSLDWVESTAKPVYFKFTAVHWEFGLTVWNFSGLNFPKQTFTSVQL